MVHAQSVAAVAVRRVQRLNVDEVLKMRMKERTHCEFLLVLVIQLGAIIIGIQMLEAARAVAVVL